MIELLCAYVALGSLFGIGLTLIAAAILTGTRHWQKVPALILCIIPGLMVLLIVCCLIVSP